MTVQLNRTDARRAIMVAGRGALPEIRETRAVPNGRRERIQGDLPGGQREKGIGNRRTSSEKHLPVVVTLLGRHLREHVMM